MTKYFLFALLLILIALTAAIGWVAGTTGGLRWSLETVSRASGVAISTGSIEGRLIDRATLKEVTITLPQQNIQLGSVSLDWKPSALLAGTIGIRELVLSNIRIQDNSPSTNEPPDLLWPRPPRLMELFDLSISRMLLDRIVYQHLDSKPTIISDISAKVEWQQQQLTLQNVTLTSAEGKLSGKIDISFRHPSLATNLDFVPLKPIAEMNRFVIGTKFLRGKDKEQLAGNFSIDGSQSGGEKPAHLQLKGVAGITRNSINLRDLALIVPDVTGEISGSGSITLTAAEPLLAMQVNVSRLNLEKLLKMPTAVAGYVKVEGTPKKYRGHLDLKNSGDKLRTGSFAGGFQGTESSISFPMVTGTGLGGDFSGNLDATWSEGLKIGGLLKGRKFDPSLIAPQWSGLVNLDLAGNITRSETNKVSGKISAVLLDSRLHGQALTGGANATIADNNLLLERLQLQGKGFNVSASGDLNKKLDFKARISDLSRLVPDSNGALMANGWVRLSNGKPNGAVTASGSNLSYDTLKITGLKLDAQAGAGADYPLRLNSTLHGVTYNKLQADRLLIGADGTASSHNIKLALKSADADVQLAATGHYAGSRWNGEIKSASGRDTTGPWSLKNPVRLSLAKDNITVSPALITTPAGERLELTVDNLKLKPLSGKIVAGWNRVNLSRANPWLKELKLAGRSNGTITAELHPGKPIVSGTITMAGSIVTKDARITIERSSLRFENGKNGLSGDLELKLKDGGELTAHVTSSSSVTTSFPERGEFKFEIKELNTALLAPWLPDGATFEGKISGAGSGRLLPGKRFEMTGSTTLANGRIRSVNKEGAMDINLRSASVNWSWRGETLEGKIALALAENGDATGSFKLPIPAGFPIVPKPDGPIQGDLKGKVRERGVLTALFPELVQESHGDMYLDIGAGGTWKQPDLKGKLALTQAGGYIPRAGIRLKDVTMAATLEKELVTITSFRALSGSGYLEGKAELQLKEGKLASYSGSINGNNFQTVSFPELEVVSTPQLTFAGSREKLTVRGEVKLPKLHVNGKQQTGAVTPSRDVIVEGRSAPQGKQMPLGLDIQVRLLLGDSVLVKAKGIDAQLGGGMELQIEGLDKIKSKGEIKVVKGRYKTYGINLDIVRGNIFYAGGYITQPSLDILALRTTGDVKAGVTVTGTLQTPLVKLYSEPTMPDVDILAYIVLGHPLGSGTEQAGLLAQAAGMLLSAGQSASLQEQIKSRLGLSTLELQSGSSKQGYMGYKPMQPTSTINGKTAATQSEGISQTILTVGKYLTPELYISYGRSLFTGENRFLLRYDIYKNWQIETQTGNESGADLYYKIEFN